MNNSAILLGRVLVWVSRLADRMPTGLRAALVCLLLAASPLYAAPFAVTAVLSENSGAYREFADALRENLSGSGLAFTVINNPAEPVPDSGLVIAAGMKAAAAVAAGRAPVVLNVIVSKSGYERLLHEFPQRARSHAFSAIFMDQPMERQVRLIEALLPGKRRVGVMYDAPPPDGLLQLRQQANRRGFTLNEQEIGKSLTLFGALQALSQDSQVLLALPDDAVYNSSTIRDILLTTYRNHIPLIGFSPGYVKAGALGAVFSTPAQIAKQAATLIEQYDGSNTLPAARYPQLFELATNEQVARSMGLNIKSSDELHQKMSAPAGDEP
jgi:putative ABC transport system substrate-binding protein